MQSVRPEEEKDGENGYGGLGIGRGAAQLIGVYKLLPAAGIRSCSGRGNSERFFREAAPVASGTFSCTHRPWILAATPRQTMRGPGQVDRQSHALGCGGCGPGNAPFSAASRGAHRRRLLAVREMKKKLIVVGVLGVAVLFVAVYLWGPGTMPPGQQPLVTLSSANIGEFETVFDADAAAPRLVLLLSPT